MNVPMLYATYVAPGLRTIQRSAETGVADPQVQATEQQDACNTPSPSQAAEH